MVPPTTLGDIFFYAMDLQDRSAIINFLLERHYIQENEALANQLSDRNKLVAKLQRQLEAARERLRDAQTELNTFRNTTRILVDRDGEQRLFRLDHDGVFVESDQEPIRSVRRRLNFDFDDYEFEENEDDLMYQLMFGSP